jgi:purine-binding chemotaxis protein CheW
MSHQHLDGRGESTEATSQYLTFALGQEEYGIDILRVQEIKGFSAVTPIPNSPAYVKGVMNLRGTVVPIFDLRLKFGMESQAYDRFTVIVVVNVGERIVGLVVDAVSDVLDIGNDSIEPAPDLGASIDTSVLQGIARNQDRLISLLAIDQVVGTDHVTTIAA